MPEARYTVSTCRISGGGLRGTCLRILFSARFSFCAHFSFAECRLRGTTFQPVTLGSVAACMLAETGLILRGLWISCHGGACSRQKANLVVFCFSGDYVGAHWFACWIAQRECGERGSCHDVITFMQVKKEHASRQSPNIKEICRSHAISSKAPGEFNQQCFRTYGPCRKGFRSSFWLYGLRG